MLVVADHENQTITAYTYYGGSITSSSLCFLGIHTRDALVSLTPNASFRVIVNDALDLLSGRIARMPEQATKLVVNKPSDGREATVYVVAGDTVVGIVEPGEYTSVGDNRYEIPCPPLSNIAPAKLARIRCIKQNVVKSEYLTMEPVSTATREFTFVQTANEFGTYTLFDVFQTIVQCIEDADCATGNTNWDTSNAAMGIHPSHIWFICEWTLHGFIMIPPLQNLPIKSAVFNLSPDIAKFIDDTADARDLVDLATGRVTPWVTKLVQTIKDIGSFNDLRLLEYTNPSLYKDCKLSLAVRYA